jgi:hypothetical protein
VYKIKLFPLEPTTGIEPVASSLPRKCSTPELRGLQILERVMGIEPTLSAWKAEVLPLNYTRILNYLVEGAGFEPAKAKPPDLQSGPFDRSGTPPRK